MISFLVDDNVVDGPSLGICSSRDLLAVNKEGRIQIVTAVTPSCSDANARSQPHGECATLEKRDRCHDSYGNATRNLEQRVGETSVNLLCQLILSERCHSLSG
ncbi:hypothetical protein PENTCL1PPCAC_30528, partial [Pristionchus entomophagus]